MIQLNPELAGWSRLTPSKKMITGLKANVEFHAISAEAGTAHGLSPVLAILDELGQVKGPTLQLYRGDGDGAGRARDPLTDPSRRRRATDADLLSILIDDARTGPIRTRCCRLYTAPKECDPFSTRRHAARPIRPSAIS